MCMRNALRSIGAFACLLCMHPPYRHARPALLDGARLQQQRTGSPPQPDKPVAHLDGARLEQERHGVLLGGRLRLVQEGHAVLQRMFQRPVAHLGQVRPQRVLRQLRELITPKNNSALAVPIQILCSHHQHRYEKQAGSYGRTVSPSQGQVKHSHCELPGAQQSAQGPPWRNTGRVPERGLVPGTD